METPENDAPATVDEQIEELGELAPADVGESEAAEGSVAGSDTDTGPATDGGGAEDLPEAAAGSLRPPELDQALELLEPRWESMADQKRADQVASCLNKLIARVEAGG